MAYDDEDLFEEEFDFVDDDDSEVDELDSEEDTDKDSEAEEEPAAKPKRRSPQTKSAKGGKKKADQADAEEEAGEEVAATEEPEKEPEPPGPPADHLVHVYEHGKFKRTISREFTDEDSVKFAEEYNRTSKPHGRWAIASEKDEAPDPQL